MKLQSWRVRAINFAIWVHRTIRKKSGGLKKTTHPQRSNFLRTSIWANSNPVDWREEREMTFLNSCTIIKNVTNWHRWLGQGDMKKVGMCSGRAATGLEEGRAHRPEKQPLEGTDSSSFICFLLSVQFSERKRGWRRQPQRKTVDWGKALGV